MANVTPIPVLRPAAALVARVAALPYDVMETIEARQMVQEEPWSFLTVEKPEATLPPEVPETDPSIYQLAASNLALFQREGVLIYEPTPKFYVYRLEWRGHVQQGLVAGAAVQDYRDGIIRRHEHTRQDKEDDRVRHILTCGAHTGPVYLAVSDAEGQLASLLQQAANPEAELYRFQGPGEVWHQVWAVEGKELAEKLGQALRDIGPAYIADGHHRCAAAERVAGQRQDPEAQQFLAVFFPETELQILPYNRVLKPLPLPVPGDLPKLLESQGFRVHPAPAGEPVWPRERGQLGLFVGERWYRLQLEAHRPRDPVQGLDVSVLQDRVLEPLLGVKDPRSDQRMRFLGGNRTPRELEQAAGTDGAAFTLVATSVHEVMQVADAGGVMPPKSTWFEPKLLSGLFVHPWRRDD